MPHRHGRPSSRDRHATAFPAARRVRTPIVQAVPPPANPGIKLTAFFLRCYILAFVSQPRPNFARSEPFHGIIRRNRP